MTDQIAITGNLTSLPERRDLAGGVTMATFGLASTDRRFVDGAWVDAHTNFYNVSVFRQLAEHALRSLVKGQRVIILGKLKLRQWEANGRTGTSADLEATSLGPDLMFGVASFTKDPRVGGATGGSPTSTDDGWAAPDPGAVDRREVSPHEAGLHEVPAREGVAAPAAGEAAAPPQLVGAGGWSVPMRDDDTPF